MKVKGMNKAYDVEVKEVKFDGEGCIVITCGNLMTGMTSVCITKENWEKLKTIK